MPEINLLPPAERTARIPVSVSCLYLFIITAGILCSVYAYQAFTIAEYENKIRQLDIQEQLLAPSHKRMQAAAAIAGETDDKNSLLVILTAERHSWHALLTRIGLVTTANVWLTEAGMAEDRSLRLKGTAVSYPDLAGYIQKLEQDQILGNAILLHSETVNNEQGNVTNFELQIKIKGL